MSKYSQLKTHNSKLITQNLLLTTQGLRDSIRQSRISAAQPLCYLRGHNRHILVHTLM